MRMKFCKKSIFELANPCLYGEIDERKICMILDEIKYERSETNDIREKY